MIFGERSRISVPLCSRHRLHFSIRMIIAIGGLSVPFLIVAVGGVLVVLSKHPLDQEHAIIGTSKYFFLSLLGWGLLVWLLEITKIRPEEMTPQTIVLRQVGDGFVRGYRRWQAAKEPADVPAMPLPSPEPEAPEEDNPFRFKA
jgi:hypothetical protein